MGSSASRLLLVSNRLPITVRQGAGGLEVSASTGGLASALRTRRRGSADLWVGWPGDVSDLDAAQLVELNERLAEQGVAPVYLAPAEAELFYEGFANGVLWPLFHYLTGVLPLKVEGWPEYVRVNERFAELVLRHYRRGDDVWIHDYHLLLLPALLRRELPEARIGFFLHTPFPSADVFAMMPNREAVLEGVLGADVVGFHTVGYRRHFESALEQVLQLEPSAHRLELGRRSVRIGVYPIGVDTAALESQARSAAVAQEVARLRGRGDCRLLLGVDRLDYTKGIPRRLLALEELLVRYPQWRGAVRLVQASVPSREGVAAYQDFRREVDGLVGRINGRFGTAHWMPVHHVCQSVPQDELVALYAAADVMLVTPVRDGMNLVAKEFVAVRSDEDGVLVLSEFAGAAAELREALLVNPYDVERTADTLHRALELPRAQRAERMRALRKRVRTRDVHWWTRAFLRDLEAVRGAEPEAVREVSPAG